MLKFKTNLSATHSSTTPLIPTMYLQVDCNLISPMETLLRIGNYKSDHDSIFPENSIFPREIFIVFIFPSRYLIGCLTDEVFTIRFVVSHITDIIIISV